MVNESNKIIVKVGNKSRVQLANSKVYRAITVNDLSKLSNRFTDCNIVIIENISEDEQKAVKEFIKNFVQTGNNSLFFFIPDSNDDITSGIADELEYNIYLTLKELYKAIYDKCGINVSIYLDDRKKLNSQELTESIPDGITDIFGGIGEESEVDIQNTINEIDQADDVKISLEKEDSKENSDNALENNSINTKVTERSTDINNENNNTESKNSNKLEDIQIGDVFSTNIEKAKTLDKNSNTDINNNNETSEYIEELKIKLRDLQYDYKIALEDMRDATTKISSLEEIIKVLRDEKEIMIERYNKLIESDEIIEDPISLAEYSILKENSEQLELRIVNLNSTIESLNSTIESKDLDINSSESTIEELKSTIESLKKEVKELKENSELDEKYKETLHEYEVKLKKYETEKIQLVQRANVLEEDNTEYSNEINRLNIRAEQEALIRLDTLSKLQTAIQYISNNNSKVSELSIENEKLSTKLNKYEEKIKNDSETIKSNLEEIANLKRSLSENNKKIELASTSSSGEVLELQSKVDKLTIELNSSRQQLEDKERQYKELFEASGGGNTDIKSLVEANKALENISQTLRNQLATATSEVAKLKKSESDAIVKMRSYKSQVDTLQKNMQNAANGNISNGRSSIKPLSYVGKSRILTVFGSGSFGITTTAMSLANRLASTSRVLYIDFDLVSPMADSWFSMNPMIQNVPGTVNGVRQNSGLGIFIEHGAGLFNNNINLIVKRVTNTKSGGGLYYLSGLYYTPDSYKLLTADYDSFFLKLSENFTYMIIDFGRLGSSDVGNAVIKAISEIAYKNIVVTTTNQFEIRNFKDKLVTNNIRLENVAWLINMCQTSAIDQKVKQLIQPCQYELMPRMEQFNQQENFLRTTLTRDRFGMFIDKKVFK